MGAYSPQSSISEPTTLQSHLDGEEQGLRFSPETERAYRQDLHQGLLRRVLTIGLAAWTIFGIFIVLDIVYLPREVYEKTVAIRLLFNYPLIGLVMLGGLKRWRMEIFEPLVISAYILCGLSIVVIIHVADWFNVFLPYDGLLILLVFGYFLLGMRFLPVALASILISAAYLGFEFYAQRPASQLFLNAFFLFSLNLMGMFGCFMQDRYRRKLFWRQLLIKKAQEKDQREIESKTRLVATASHDLRQPMHAMNLLVDTLQEQLQGQPQQALADKLEHSIRQLNQLLSSLLSISRLNAGIVEVKKQPLNLNALVAELIDEVEARCDASGLAIELESAGVVFVDADAVLLQRVLRNLIENILNHAQASRACVRIAEHDGRIVLTVEDDGIGIDESKSEQVFEEFHQSSQGQHRGMGLGLAIVRQLCELMAIPVTLHSSVGQGCVFRLDLGAPVEPRTANVSKRWSNTPMTGARILVIEDDEDNRQSMAERIEHWGMQVVAGADYESLSDEALSQPVDLLITDMHLGKGQRNGAEGIAWLRQQHGKDIPALLLTADTEVNEEMLETPKLDMASIRVLHKPVQAAKLRVAINQLLQVTVAPE